MMPRLIDLTGRKFSRWTVIRRGENIGVKPGWFCKCECGNTETVLGHSLKSGTSTSCGCAHIDAITKHGMIGTPTHRSWTSMKSRCNNEKSPGFHRYGGRGIKVCERWEIFENFLEDMGERPENTTLDRIDNDGDYEPGNCRWATHKTQARNNSRNKRFRYKGKIKTVTEWCEVLNVPVERVRGRLSAGWCFKDAVEKPRMTPIGTPGVASINRKDISGKSYGMLTVIRYHDTINKRARWFCTCECGNSVVVPGKDLRQGRTVSCGCKRGQPKCNDS